MSDDTPGYAAALTELESILAALDGDDVDIDRLSTDVRRAAELISVCRDRLTATRTEVERIVADLDPGRGNEG
ncbi:MAG: exodeoxyribonuclease VII small subunit [Actinomycetota bacterium]|jgi:exodeoxyribonuclease VII small subunit|nr:exodeoxyribonuclease VII small subunit [Actinomycetota bacterium]